MLILFNVVAQSIRTRQCRTLCCCLVSNFIQNICSSFCFACYVRVYVYCACFIAICLPVAFGQQKSRQNGVTNFPFSVMFCCVLSYSLKLLDFVLEIIFVSYRSDNKTIPPKSGLKNCASSKLTGKWRTII